MVVEEWVPYHERARCSRCVTGAKPARVQRGAVVVARDPDQPGRPRLQGVQRVRTGAAQQVPQALGIPGLPVGGELDYLDEGTLAQAIRARRPIA